MVNLILVPSEELQHIQDNKFREIKDKNFASFLKLNFDSLINRLKQIGEILFLVQCTMYIYYLN